MPPVRIVCISDTRSQHGRLTITLLTRTNPVAKVAGLIVAGNAGLRYTWIYLRTNSH
jgi:hypothetical protein